MMRQLLVVCGVLVLLAAGTAGQTTDDSPDDDVDPRPGLIEADSTLYGLDVAIDNAMIAVGLKRASDVVHERASEAVIAAEANNTAAAERAASEASRMAQVAHGLNGDGLESAETLLREVRDRVPGDAYDGLDTAINEVMKAKERMATDLPENPEVPDQPDSGPADTGGAPIGGDQ